MRRRFFVIGLFLVGALFLAMSARLFVWPPTDPLPPAGDADAVVVLAGGAGERLDRALDLMRAGVAPVLVVSRGMAPTWPQANAICQGEEGWAVLCPHPEPDTTQGEARAVARLAAEHGWRRVLVVTSTYHVTRSRLLFERCLEAQVLAVGARPQWTAPTGARIVAHEWLGWAWAHVGDRGC